MSKSLIEINLEEGMPTSDEAMSQLKMCIKNSSKKSCIYIIHGYGSSGVGGVIRLKARQWLSSQVKKGAIKAMVNGEDFNIFNSKARELKHLYPQLEALTKVFNQGVTIVEV